MRTGAYRRPFVGSASLSSTPAPTPIEATFSEAATTLLVTWDQALNPISLDPTNWSCWALDQFWKASSALVSGNTTRCKMLIDTEITHDAEWNYQPPPTDVQNTEGTPAIAYANEKLTIVP